MHFDNFISHVTGYFEDISKEASLKELIAKPTAIGWKVASGDFMTTLRSMTELWDIPVEQCHIGSVNDRFIASILFSDSLYSGIKIVKLMQRRPGSNDAIGCVDHVDFFTESLPEATALLGTNNIPNELESNDAHSWISARVGKDELKFVDHIVLEVCINELKTSTDAIYKQLAQRG